MVVWGVDEVTYHWNKNLCELNDVISAQANRPAACNHQQRTHTTPGGGGLGCCRAEGRTGLSPVRVIILLISFACPLPPSFCVFEVVWFHDCRSLSPSLSVFYAVVCKSV